MVFYFAGNVESRNENIHICGAANSSVIDVLGLDMTRTLKNVMDVIMERMVYVIHAGAKDGSRIRRRRLKIHRDVMLHTKPDLRPDLRQGLLLEGM